VTAVDNGSTNIASDLTLQNLRNLNLKVGCVQHVLVDSVFNLYYLHFLCVFFSLYYLHFFLYVFFNLHYLHFLSLIYLIISYNVTVHINLC